MSRIVRLRVDPADQWRARAARATLVDASARRARAEALAHRAADALDATADAWAGIAEAETRRRQIVFAHNRDVLLASITAQMKSAGWNCACDGGRCHCNRKGHD